MFSLDRARALSTQVSIFVYGRWPRIGRAHDDDEIAPCALPMHRDRKRVCVASDVMFATIGLCFLGNRSCVRLREKHTLHKPKALLISKREFHSFHENLCGLFLSCGIFSYAFYCYDGKIIKSLRYDLN